MLPEQNRCTSILEVYLYGGVSQYESLYCVLDFGKDDGTHWYTYLNSGDIDQAVIDGNITDPLTQEFATHTDGRTVNLGPFVSPLRQRPDVLDRLRITINSTYLGHEGAIPLGLGGRRFGHPALAGLGAHIQRYFAEVAGAESRAPYSYVLSSATPLLNDLTRSASAIGLHPGAFRPLTLKVDAAGDINALLAELAR